MNQIIYTAASKGFQFLMMTETPNILDQALDALKNGIIFIGGLAIVYGVVMLGMALFGSQGGGGAQIGSALMAIAAGGVIIAAAAYLSSLDTSFVDTSIIPPIMGGLIDTRLF